MLNFVAGEARSKEDSQLVAGIGKEIGDISKYDPDGKFKALVKHQKDLQGVVDRAREADKAAAGSPKVKK